MTVSAQAIREAYPRIPAAFRGMPQWMSEPLTERLGVPVVVKLETPNPIGCFKGRGTWLAVEHLFEMGDANGERGIVVASAGNFGQGVAYAGRARGVPVAVWAAETALPIKLAAMRRLGAEVHLGGQDFDASRAHAVEMAADRGWQLLVDGVDPWITIGAGSIGLELTDAIEAGDLPPLTACFVPVGDGALIGGIGTWLRATTPGTRVVGVVAEQAPAMALSWRAARPVITETAGTIADGIAVREVMREPLDLLLTVVDDMREVSEDAIQRAMDELRAALSVSVEPAAAVSWAAAVDGERPTGAIGIIITGANVAADLLPQRDVM